MTMQNLLAFPASTTMTPLQALLSALEFANNDDLSDVLIVGYDSDGELVVRSSKMQRQDALWMAEKLRIYALDDNMDMQ